MITADQFIIKCESAQKELSETYKLMIDEMLEQEEKGDAKFVSKETIKRRFYNK